MLTKPRLHRPEQRARLSSVLAAQLAARGLVPEEDGGEWNAYHMLEQARPAANPFASWPLCGARTPNATGQSRVTAITAARAI